MMLNVQKDLKLSKYYKKGTKNCGENFKKIPMVKNLIINKDYQTEGKPMCTFYWMVKKIIG